MCNALGLINLEHSSIDVAGMTDYRTVSAISFLGRYRLIDFTLSNMSNSGISQIQVYMQGKPRSIIEHIGSENQYNINPKRGMMRVLHGEQRIQSEVYNTDIAQFSQNIHFIEESNHPYVIIAPTYMVYRCNYDDLLKAHVKSGNDVSVLYTETGDAKERFHDCDVLQMNDQKRVMSFDKNRGKFKNRNISMECYVLSKRLFLKLIRLAQECSSLYWFKDILADSCQDIMVGGIAHKGYVACINSLPAYMQENLKLNQVENIRGLFTEDWPIYTRTNDSAPTQYTRDASVKTCSVANGCFIEGEIENCVLGRNVVVRKGAVVKNSILLQGAYVSEDSYLDGVIVDKEAMVYHTKELVKQGDEPIYVKRRDRI